MIIDTFEEYQVATYRHWIRLIRRLSHVASLATHTTSNSSCPFPIPKSSASGFEAVHRHFVGHFGPLSLEYLFFFLRW
jgi:hypothetical protein